MPGALSDLEREYTGALEAYVEQPGELTLSQAYTIGRRSLVSGLGLLDLVSLHGRALAQVAPSEHAPGGLSSERADTFLRELLSPFEMTLRGYREPRDPSSERAQTFLREVLSPFEMTLRGYREANERLSKLNEELRAQKEAAEAANKELEAFSYSVSHDLRAPLRGLDGFSQALLEDYGDEIDEQGKRYLRYVRESAQEMARLIDGLLDLSRVTRAELHRTTVDLAAMARRIAERLRATEPERRVEIAIPEALPAVGDRALLEVVLQNLLGNAWKFTATRPVAHIELGALRDAGRTAYFVRDDGVGFDMAHSPQLFGVFQRLHSAKAFEGTGIGLATVKRIVQRHGGEVWAEGRVDAGATFYFTLGPG